jgi:AraC-like DNA-binding protein
MEAHSHPFHEVIFVLQGAMDVRLAEGILRGEAGDVLIYPADTVHEEFALPPSPLETYYLAFETAEALGKFPRIIPDTEGRLRTVANWVYQDRDLPEPCATQSAAANLRVLLAEFQRLSTEREHALIVRTRQFIRSHIGEDLTLDQLAAHVKMSKYHFARSYKELSGHPPAHDIRMMRVQYARNLLLTSNLPLKSIAPMVGLGDAYHLSRMFRKYLNLSPRQLRSQGAMDLNEE